MGECTSLGGGGIVVISGAGSGIGRATALHLAQCGYVVVPGVRSQQQASDLLSAAGPSDEMHPVLFDVTNQGQVDSLVERVADLAADGPGLAGVFSNAGVTAFAGDISCEGTSIEALLHLVQVNYLGAARFIQAFIPLLRRDRGTVIVNSAMMAHTVLPFSAGYAPSKAALEAWADSLRRETAGEGLKVVMIELGGVATGIAHHSESETAVGNPSYPAEQSIYRRLSELAKRTDDPRLDPQRVAELVERILQTRNPRPRYRDGGGSTVLGLLGDLPDRIQDFAIGRMLSK